MTGAAVPEGADAVFMVEHAEYRETSAEIRKSVRLQPARTLKPGDNIVPRGAEAHAGDPLIPAGVRLTPAHIALAAQCGYAQIPVHPRPRVAILATGDELVSVQDTPGPHQIRNSNSPMLAAMVSAAGAEPVLLSAVQDRQELLDAAIQSVVDSALNVAMLLVSGGISAGRFDLVDRALIHAGATFLFRGLAIQPGKPLAFGELAGTLNSGAGKSAILFFALPGNPISSAVTFHLFAAPILAALAGESATGPRFAQAQLAEDWQGKPGLTRFLPAFCDFALNPTVRVIPWQGSGDLAAFARSNCCLVIPDDVELHPAGSSVQILLTASF
jgi:molybdopterin molybdotransferase